MITQQIENLNKETSIIKKGTKWKILELKSKTHEIKNLLEGFNGKFELAHTHTKISRVDESTMEINQSEEKKEK